MMADLILFDVFENILLRLDDVTDLIRCKSVCKSWHSFITSHRFVKSHLNNSFKNDVNNCQLGHRRITRPTNNENQLIYANLDCIVGSSNGLVCVSPQDVEFVVTNPFTRQVKFLETPTYSPDNIKVFDLLRPFLCWGFGYDSSTDDYKVIVGFNKGIGRTRFIVLTLRSNKWKLIGDINCKFVGGSKYGILFNGSLHWFMKHYKNPNTHDYKKVILSFNLSTEKFKKIPQPDHHLYEHDNNANRLGVFEQRLCIFPYGVPSCNKWVMKNKNHWELIPYDYEMKYDIVHHLKMVENYYVPTLRCSFNYDGQTLSTTGDYICAHTFVQTLVSPHVNGTSTSITKNPKEGNESAETIITEDKIRKRKRSHVTYKFIQGSMYLRT